VVKPRVSGDVALAIVFLVLASTVMKLDVFVSPFKTEKISTPSSFSAFASELGTNVD
jgi:hypothetical protein